MRIFLAVDLDDSLRSGIAAVQRSLGRERIPGIRWTDPRGIHLTLRFCGEISPEVAGRIRGAVAPGAPCRPFSVPIGGLGLFPPRGAPRVLFLGAREAGSLETLAAWVEERVVSAGLPREGRPFHPHLTLGRFRPGARRPAPEVLEDPVARELGILRVERFVMFESHLGPGGARYEALEIFPLLEEVG